MSRLTRFFRHVLRRRDEEASMHEEMAYHLEMRARQFAEDEGVAPEKARDAALRRFGNVARVQEEARSERTGARLDRLGKDLLLSLRALGKAPGYALTAILTLALGVGATTAVYSVIHALLLAPLPYSAADRLVEIQSLHPEQGASDLAPATFGDLHEGNNSFAAVAGQYYYYLNLTGVEDAARVNSADVTADFFSVFGVAPLRGRIWT
ncbi:MAG TPA: permease prefix domain 1-containing protein, partial [Candidatus Didemnitutus sp.]